MRFLALATLAALAVACGGRSLDPPGRSEGPSGSLGTSTTSTGNASTAANAPSSAQVAALCTAYQSTVVACSETDTCSQALSASCADGVATVVSSAAIDAFTACLTSPTTSPCAATPLSIENPCIKAAITPVAPSAAQMKVETDFCTACPTPKQLGVAPCIEAFFAWGQGDNGPGFPLLGYDDDVAQKVDALCVPAITTPVAPACTPDAFTRCMAAQALPSALVSCD